MKYDHYRLCCKFRLSTNILSIIICESGGLSSSQSSDNKLLFRLTSSLSSTSLADGNSWLSSPRLLVKRTTTNITNNVPHRSNNTVTLLVRDRIFTDNIYKYFISNKLVQNHRLFSRTISLITEEPRKMAKIISGKEVADEIRANLKLKISNISVKPKLAIVQVGGREDSNVYIKMKMQYAESIGADTELVKLDREVTEKKLAQKVQQLNQDISIHGIITQLPFDSINHINSDKIINLIDPRKDVDGLCVYNAGKLLHGELNSSSFIPCTPNGCMELIKKSGIKLEGTRSVVIGRSKIVGAPMAQLLLWHNSTVTICHSRTKNLDEICRSADIVVAAVGRAQMVKKSWIKPGAVVVDCGINVISDPTKKSGTRLVGDVDFEECKEIAGAITPVPGGVGPMTVAMLISNTVESAIRASKSDQ